MQLVPRPGCAGVPIKMAEHREEHRELAEQSDTGKGQWRFVRVAGHVVGHLLPRLGLLHLLERAWAVVAMLQDNTCSLEPRFMGRDSAGGHPDLAGVAEVGAEGLLGTA